MLNNKKKMKVAFYTLGCKVNQYETNGMIQKFKSSGYDIVEFEEKADIYMVEPYVVAADVYANPEHVGRGGWTWYTGSAAWMYKVIEDNFKEGQEDITVKKTRTRKKKEVVDETQDIPKKVRSTKKKTVKTEE